MPEAIKADGKYERCYIKDEREKKDHISFSQLRNFNGSSFFLIYKLHLKIINR